MALMYLELALNIGYELARLNGTSELFHDFWKFVTMYYKKFPGEYKMNSHSRRNTTGTFEKTLVTYLIKICCYKCSLTNCQMASQILVLLGYDSYRLMTHRFRQKVENYLRKERKEGGKVPPSTRAFPYFSYSSSLFRRFGDEKTGYNRPTTRSQTMKSSMENDSKTTEIDGKANKNICSEVTKHSLSEPDSCKKERADSIASSNSSYIGYSD